MIAGPNQHGAGNGGVMFVSKPHALDPPCLTANRSA